MTPRSMLNYQQGYLDSSKKGYNVLDLPLDKIQKFCKQEDIAYMAIFGSYAKGEAGPDSDIDILLISA